MARHSSDHNTLLLSFVDSLVTSPKPFRFQTMWCTNNTFLPSVHRRWQTEVSSNPLTKFVVKLWSLKLAILTWNKEVYRYTNLCIPKAQSDVQLI